MPTRDTTFCFTDIAGSTDILRRLGESRYDELLERHRELIRAALAAAGGHEIKTEGDGFFVTFDDPASSLRFAVDAQRALAQEDWPVPVRVRMGFHRGPGTKRADGDYSSLAAHQAARVSAAAHGGQVLLTAEVVRDVDPSDDAHLVHLGPHRLRDFDGGMELLQLAAPGLERRFPPLRVTRDDHGLPLPRTSMVGRDAELRQLRTLLLAQPFVTLHGPGGVGKTRLALEAASLVSASFPDGLHFVELSPLADGDLVVPTVATAIGVRPSPDQDPLDAVVARLGAGARLLVLDSAERVLDHVAALVDAVVRGCPRTTVLVTSTEPVHLPDERVVPVLPLQVPPEGSTDDEALESEAVRLLVQRSTARGAAIGDGASVAGALTTIVQRLDGIPLAIELAAGRVADIGADATLTGLDDRFSLLTNGWRTALPRHRTLEAMVQWTVEQLDPSDRALAARLATLRGRWVAADAVDVVGEDASEGGVHRLVDRSLLWVDEATTPPRLRMYDTVRAFLSREIEPDEARALLTRKRRWLIARGVAIADGPDREIRRELDHLIPDLREVIAPDPGEPDDVRAAIVDAAALTAPYFEAAGLWDEGIRRIGSAVADAPDGPQRTNAMSVLANLVAHVGDNDGAAAMAREVLDSSDAPDRARALACLVLSPPGAPIPEGRDLLAEAVALAGDEGASLALAARVRIGLRMLIGGDAEGAVAEFREIAELGQRHGRTMHRAQALTNLGGALIRTGRIDEAEVALREGRELALEAQLPKVAAGCLTNLGMLALFRGDPASAVELAEERLTISLEMGDLAGAAAARMLLGNASALLDDRPRAREEMRQAYDLFRKIGVVEGCATALFNVVVLAARDGGHDEAARAAAELAHLARPLEMHSIQALTLLASAGVAAVAGRLDGAVLLGAAATHSPTTTPLDPSDVAWLETCQAALVEATSVDAVLQARADGGALPLADALDLAVSVADGLVEAG